jgi:anti-sigma-K factor RskA
MTGPSQPPDDRDCGADAAAYVLGALEPGEAEAFRRHLATCAVCRDEVNEFRAVVSALPLAAPPHPAPRSLKRHVMAGVRAAQRGQGAPAPRSRRRRVALRRPALAIAAGLAVVLAAFAFAGGFAGTSTRVIHASLVWKSASAVLQISGGHGELVVHRMPPPPAGKVYEVWVQHRTQPPSPTNALFSVTASGSGTVGVPGSLRGVSQVMVTPEPAGGSKVPTHPAVLVARLA